MEVLESIVEVGNRLVWQTPEDLPWLVLGLLLVGVVVTLRLVFIQVRRVGHAIRVVLGHFDDDHDPGDVSHFQALSTALSATVGIGNIAGVATAIHYGGPGAVFWMWMTAALGMAIKFAECTLAVKYRSFDERGDAAGGPMYYIEKGLGPRWKPLAVFFAVCAVIASFGGGNMNQANTVAVSAHSDFGIAGWLVGIVLVVVVGAVILGGIRSIARVSSALAPSMAAIYVFAALTILVLNIGEVPSAFATIVSHAMNPRASVGGSVAGFFFTTMMWGVKRGLFSNEAGQGSSPIAHAAARTDEPVREGAVAMLEPLIDTLIICTMTALVIVITGVWDQKRPVDMALEPSKVTVSLVAPEETVVVDNAEQAAQHGVKRAGQYLVVEGGSSEALRFVSNDSQVDDAVLLGPSGQPYTGTLGPLSVDAAGVVSGLTTAGGDPLILRGLALQNSSALTAWAFQKGLSPLGDWGNFIVTLCVFLFAVSTMVSWSYYGDRCITYLFGSRYVFFYRLVFIGFVYVGSTTALEVVWAYGDLALGLMTVPNLIAIILLLPQVVRMSRDYFQRMEAKVPAAVAEVDERRKGDA